MSVINIYNSHSSSQHLTTDFELQHLHLTTRTHTRTNGRLKMQPNNSKILGKYT